MAKLAYGEETAELIQTVLNEGVERAVVLMRHSARTFDPAIHDLANQLTEEGRELAAALGAKLPPGLYLRGYASPPQRCVDTAELLLEGYRDARGSAARTGRTRTLEALGVFYVMDQVRMWKGLQATKGLQDYLARWFAGEVGPDIAMPAAPAAQSILRVLAGRLDAAPVEGPSLDICVSHDMSVHLVRDQLLKQGVEAGDVRFLDALVLYREDGSLWLRSHLGPPVAMENAV